jgi:hypothetical protein
MLRKMILSPCARGTGFVKMEATPKNLSCMLINWLTPQLDEDSAEFTFQQHSKMALLLTFTMKYEYYDV